MAPVTTTTPAKKAPPKQRQLDPETRSYFQSVEQLLNDMAAQVEGGHKRAKDDNDDDDGDDATARALLVQNVYREVDGHEAHLVTDPDCSRIVERLLMVSTAAQARSWFNKMAGDFAFIMSHINASHVVQTLLMRTPTWLTQTDARGDVEGMDKGLLSLEELVVAMAEELAVSIVDLSFNAYASHVVRVLINLLAGLPVGLLTRSKQSKQYRQNAELDVTVDDPENIQRIAVPDSFKAALVKLTDATLTSSQTEGDTEPLDPRQQLREMAQDRLASPVLQLLMIAHAPNRQTLTAFLDKLLKDQDDAPLLAAQQYNSDFVSACMTNDVGSHVLEVVLRVAPAPIYLGLYVAHFRGKLVELAQHPVSNYVVARLISCSKSPVHADMLLDELVPSITSLMTSNRVGVVHRMVEMCARFPGPRQKRLMQAVAMAVQGHLPENRKHLLSLLMTLNSKTGIAPLGSQIVQALFGFEEAELLPLIASLLSTDPGTLVEWSKVLGGSRVIESFLSSKASSSFKTKLIAKLEGRFAELAMDKYGSHTLDACWANSDLTAKEKIARDLADHEQTLSSNFYGRFALRNCQVNQFRRRAGEWREREQGKQRKQALFNDIVGEPPSKKHKAGQTASKPVATPPVADHVRSEHDEHLAKLQSAEAAAAAIASKKAKGQAKTKPSPAKGTPSPAKGTASKPAAASVPSEGVAKARKRHRKRAGKAKQTAPPS